MRYLNWIFPVGPGILNSVTGAQANELFLVQNGANISEINRLLETHYRRSLRTSGASNGQTIAGAISTSTHGSAIDHGPIQNHVVGLHLIVGPDRHLWLERESDPITNDTLAFELGAEVVRDDDAFNSALVSFGSFGIIHLVLMETDPLFLLESWRDWLPLNDNLWQTLATLSFDEISLPGNGTRPYFFSAVINPFDRSRASVTAMYKMSYKDEHVIDYGLKGGLGPGYELLGPIGTITDALPHTIPSLVTELANQRLDKIEGRTGTLGETFDFTTPRSHAAGAAFAVDVEDTPKAIRILLEEQDHSGPAGVVFACRYVRKSDALLAFTKFPINCVIDIDGVYSKRTVSFLNATWSRLEREAIDYAWHWGKLNGYTASNIRRRFGENNIETWLQQRDRLLSTDANKQVFSNPFTRRLGLTR